VGAKLFHAGRQTDGRKDMTKLIVAFRNFAKAPHTTIGFDTVRVRLKRDGTSLREEVGEKGNPANGVGTQLMTRERQITAGPALLPTRRCAHFAC
jgi:hypothetical protein